MKRKVTDLKPNEAILISNDADLKVLEEFEKAGITWIDGANANSFNPLAFSGEEELIIHIEQDRIVWAYSQVSVLTIYPATDFIGSEGDSVDKFDQAIKLLRDLADLQNGAPLEQHRSEWEQTMDEVYTFLNQHEPRNTPTYDHPNQPWPDRQAADRVDATGGDIEK